MEHYIACWEAFEDALKRGSVSEIDTTVEKFACSLRETFVNDGTSFPRINPPPKHVPNSIAALEKLREKVDVTKFDKSGVPEIWEACANFQAIFRLENELK